MRETDLEQVPVCRFNRTDKNPSAVPQGCFKSTFNHGFFTLPCPVELGSSEPPG